MASKVTKLMTMGLDRRRSEQLNLEDNIEWETKTVTSAIKTFLRNLPGNGYILVLYFTLPYSIVMLIYANYHAFKV